MQRWIACRPTLTELEAIRNIFIGAMYVHSLDPAVPSIPGSGTSRGDTRPPSSDVLMKVPLKTLTDKILICVAAPA